MWLGGPAVPRKVENTKNAFYGGMRAAPVDEEASAAMVLQGFHSTPGPGPLKPAG